jgi:hypothetical protein
MTARLPSTRNLYFDVTDAALRLDRDLERAAKLTLRIRCRRRRLPLDIAAAWQRGGALCCESLLVWHVFLRKHYRMLLPWLAVIAGFRVGSGRLAGQDSHCDGYGDPRWRFHRSLLVGGHDHAARTLEYG